MKKKCVKVEFDRYELGMIINALNELRSKQINANRPQEPVDELFIRLCRIYNNESVISKLFGRKVYECR